MSSLPSALSERPSRSAAALWALGALLWFVPLNTPHLFNPDEGRYAEIPREMLQSGDWVTPRLDGILYFEKPPLQYWATATAYALFGEHIWTARLWSALCGFLGLPLIYALARRLYGREAARCATLLQGSALLYLGLARVTTLDMSLCFGLQLALTALVLVARAGPRDAPPDAAGRAAPWLLGVGVALAVLSKGLIGILLPGATAALYMLACRDWTLPLRARVWWTLAALAVLALPWFALVAARNPGFAEFFFVVQHVHRYLSVAGFNRYQPAWFFIPVLLLGWLPWTTLLPGSLARALRAAGAGERASALLLIWAAFVFLFFSLSQSKLVPYILPLVPALALLGGRALAEMPLRALARHLRATAVFCLALAILATLLPLLPLLPVAARLVAQASRASLLGYAAAWLLLALGTGIGAVLARRAREPALLAAAAGSLLFAQAALLATSHLPRNADIDALERAMRPYVDRDTRLYCVGDYTQTIPFDFKRPCMPVGYRGELDFGLTQEPERGELDLSRFAARWRLDADAVALVTPQDLRLLQALGAPLRVIYTAPTLIVVARR
jgi:4-amino-4-deoxy-L-arabinose transferase-like glycosyltransferase